MSYQGSDIAEEFLEQVKSKLPEWLKWKELELKNVLDDLETQILNEAKFIANGEEPTRDDIQQAIDQMGSPQSIARIYKQRSTPKFYLSEELFEFYLRSLMFFSVIVILINIVIMIFRVFIDPLDAILGALSGIWIGFLILIVVITVIFVYFSHEGFLPEDFGILPKRLAIIFPMRALTQERLDEIELRTKESLAEAKAKAKEKIAKARARAQEKIAEAKARREEKIVEVEIKRQERKEEARLRKEEAKARRELKKKEPISLGELIFGFIAGVIFGLILIFQPFSVIGLFDQAFLDWLKLFGLFVFIGGLIDLARLAISVRNFTGQQIMLFVVAFYSAVYIPLFLNLLDQPEIFPISLFSGGIVPIITDSQPYSLEYIIYFWVIVLIIVSVIIGMISNFYKVYKIQKLKY
jgi:cation transport ATPase